ncbi:hypothetical protein F6455_04610 [Proteobacteria bacterium 005FR1]|nr:hypothetical protein [Proteobacteria bacterium 005FR1]
MSRIALPPAFSRALMTTASLLACNLVFAQPDGKTPGAADPMAKDWYKVEMIVFAQTPSSSEEGEIWRTDVKLDYPLNWVELMDPAQLMERIAKRERAAADQQHAELGVVSGLESTTPNGEPNPAVAPPQTRALAADTPSEGETVPGIAEASDEEEGKEALGPVKALAEKTLLLLPREELSLTSEARRLSRSDQRRVLFHGAWLQPLPEDRKEPSVLISGGERFDEHHELEGSVNIYRRTYLHIETDLWLSQFATNFGQERRPWPPLPWPPNRTPEPSFLFRIDDGGTGLWHQFNQTQDKDVNAILAQPYVVENVVLMQQGRRMRSEELHYIDHPKLGLLIKITPYQPPKADGESSSGS